MVHLRSCHALETRTGGETSNFRGKLGNWGSSRFSSGVITDADPSARHAPLLLIRSHHNVSSLSLSLINDTLPSFKSMKPQTESVNCTANPLHQCTAKLRYKEWTGGCNESRAGKDYIWPHRDNQRTANKDVTENREEPEPAWSVPPLILTILEWASQSHIQSSLH